MRPDLAETGGRDAAVEPVPTPVDLGAAPAVDVDASNGYHLCALDADGATWCWGNAEVGQLGPGVPAATVSIATPVRQDLPPATAVRTGYDLSCALLGPDDLRCWGDGDPLARNPWTGETGPPAGGFREPGPLVPTVTTYIPTPADVSTDPPVVGANLVLAAAVMILFTIAGELLNRTLAENEDAFAARGGVLARLRQARRRIDRALERRLGRGRLLTAVQLAGIAAIYGLVFSLLDRTWDPLSVTGLWLFFSMAVAFGIVGIADDLACWSVARRWGVAADLDLRPGNLLAAVASTAASRVAALLPGVMIGMPEALEVDVEALDDRRRARLAAVGLGTLAVIGTVAWAITLVTAVAGSAGEEGIAVLLGGVEAFFLVVFAVTVQNGFAQLLAFRGTPGRVLRTTHRWAWLGALLLVTFLFWHTLVNPRGDLAAALGETNVVAFMATAVGFVAVSGAAWAWFRLRRRQGAAGATPEAPVREPSADAPADGRSSVLGAASPISTGTESRAGPAAAGTAGDARAAAAGADVAPAAMFAATPATAPVVEVASPAATTAAAAAPVAIAAAHTAAPVAVAGARSPGCTARRRRACAARRRPPLRRSNRVRPRGDPGPPPLGSRPPGRPARRRRPGRIVGPDRGRPGLRHRQSLGAPARPGRRGRPRPADDRPRVPVLPGAVAPAVGRGRCARAGAGVRHRQGVAGPPGLAGRGRRAGGAARRRPVVTRPLAPRPRAPRAARHRRRDLCGRRGAEDRPPARAVRSGAPHGRRGPAPLPRPRRGRRHRGPDPCDPHGAHHGGWLDMRRIVALAIAGLLVAGACSEAFEPPPPDGAATGGPPDAAATRTGDPTPPATADAAPVVMDVADLPEEGDAVLAVRVLGWVEPGSSVLCGSGTCYVDLHDPLDPRRMVSLLVATDAEGTPNTMVGLGSGFEDADLRVTADDGTLLRSGDHAWITGTWKADGDTLVASTIEPGAPPPLKAVESTIARLRSRKAGTYVRVAGRLDTPFMLSCFGGSCNLYIEDAAGRTVRLEVRLGRKGEVRANTMWPLKDGFRPKDLRVIDARGRTTRAGDRVVVEGWLQKTEDGTPYLDPTMKIVRRGT